jgi:response regulator of citrate/malate metabolism
MDGITCLGILKKIERLKYAKFLCTLRVGPSALENSRKLGANDFIIKPVRKAELKERLSGYFRMQPLIIQIKYVMKHHEGVSNDGGRSVPEDDYGDTGLFHYTIGRGWIYS